MQNSTRALEASLRLESTLGGRAKEVLDNPAFCEAFEQLDALIRDQMRRSGFDETAQHSKLIIAYQLLHGIRQALEQYMETGSMADTQLAEITSR